MKKSIFEEYQKIKKKFKTIQKNFLNKSSIYNSKSRPSLQREYTKLFKIISNFKKIESIRKEIEEIKKLILDEELKSLALEELNKLINLKKKVENRLRNQLTPKDQNDRKDCFLEIKAGTGGSEAAIFAKDLFRMYCKYAESCSWKVEIISINEIESGSGYKEIIAKISGKEVYRKLKFESGGHRVQRIPETESRGRIHTSSCKVAILLKVDASEIKINQNDIRIDTFRSSGAGGQHVNTTNSAIRVTHIPTGISVECQDERSQHKNRAKAMSVLLARLKNLELKKVAQEKSYKKKFLFGSGERSDRIRTYNFQRGTIVDHRTNSVTYQINEVMNGKLEILIGKIVN
ncbi:peptide chain release factor 1 [Candidatus Riesia pediculicola]|uniref:Peptide chain release factor 1 n=1 Tax=Riesia pediculicola (strain USDA) TaxID=515618 RepID=D4G8P4_RIEPU|nr:peptide chain release factor 1 [Candidatus Riesia pediculicola]ADD79688.1 peptide chain release factor 1 [Candidatus Riesia pediculicola USDA]ARC53920.1 peptide chain release factor 1 [Candidatus Riesia pediculicola]QOJ86548.1 peptide chain release factor 1 [Candidatus Riesia pediculicola]